MTYHGAFPIVSTRRLELLLEFYETALDAEVTYRFPPEGEAGYVAVTVGDSPIGLALEPDAPGAETRQRTAIWFYADDCQAAVDRMAAAGATVLSPPADMPWGERVAHLSDPDGNPVHVGQRLAAAEPPPGG